ncbi:MAG: D-alanyl-D-alanine carboxypeptidase/D-alanyl-D-alanine-endopeptidase [Cyanobacteria bacterium P01_F01_bin.33]
MKRRVAVGMLAALLVSWSGGQPARSQPTVQQAFQTLKQQSGMEPATAVFLLRDLSTGEILASEDGNQSMVPASTMKILATAFATSQFGFDRRWQTRLVLPEATNGGKANVVAIVGAGDPTLGSPQIEGNPSTDQLLADMTQAIRSAGITQIERLVADISALPVEPIPWSWTYDDFGNYFGAPVSALNINDNLYKLTFRPAGVGQAAAIVGIQPNLAWLSFQNQMRTGAAGSGDNGYIFGVPGDNRRWVRGTIPAGGDFPIYGSLPDPPDALLQLLQARLAAAGVTVNRLEQQTTPVAASTVLWQQDSPRAIDIIRHVHDTSFNLYADGLLLLASQTRAGSRPVPSWSEAIDMEEEWLKSLGVDLRGFRLEDGSGLSRRNLVTPKGMTDVLHRISQQSWWTAYGNTLEVRNSQRRPNGAVRGKTGFITGVRSLSGVITCRSGRTLAFSVIVNHFDKSLGPIDAGINQWLDAVWQSY